MVAFTGFDFLGGGFRNNAATIFVTQIPWDKRKGVTTPQVVGDFFMKTGDIKEGLALAFGPPAIFGLGARAARSSTFAIAVKVGRRHWPRQWAALLGRLQQEEMFVQVNTLWKPNVPQLYVDVDREKAKALGVSVDEIFNTLVGHARQLLRQRLQQVRPHVASVDERRARVSHSAPTISARCGCAPNATRWCRCARWRASSTRRARTRSIDTTICRR